VSVLASPFQSTLLDVLAGRKNTGTTTGTIRFGGGKPTPAFLKRYTGYVEQTDTLLDNLTVAEMLQYQAELKRPHTECKVEKRRAVRLMLKWLRLESCAHTVIGNVLSRGISGGQSKRVNIGIALITEPRVLFLDEPTSGLDSFTADEVMTVVKDLTSTGVTICSTIHSPSTFTFGLFDDLLMLNDGRVIYFGEARDTMIGYFKGLPVQLPEQRAAESEAEWLVRTTTGHMNPSSNSTSVGVYLDDGDDTLETQATFDVVKGGDQRKTTTTTTTIDFADHWAGSEAFGTLKLRLEQLGRIPPPKAEDDSGHGRGRGTSAVSPKKGGGGGDMVMNRETSSSSSFRRSNSMAKLQDTDPHDLHAAATTVPMWYAMLTMARYRGRANIRDGQYIGARLGDKMLACLVVLILFVGQGDDIESPDKIINTSSILFMSTVLPSFGAAAYVPSIVLERALFYRERADGCYSTATYVLYKFLEEFVVAIPISLVICILQFFPLKLLGSFLAFWLIYLFTLTTGISIAYLISSICPTMEVANAALPALVVVMLYFAGAIVLRRNVPSYLVFMPYIDWLAYSWGGMMQNQFRGVADKVFQAVDGQGELLAEYTPLEFYGLEDSFPPGRWWSIAILIAFTSTFTLLSIFTLSKISMVKR